MILALALYNYTDGVEWFQRNVSTDTSRGQLLVLIALRLALIDKFEIKMQQRRLIYLHRR